MSPKGTIVLTGANGGIGSAIVSRILNSPELSSYHGIYTVRNASSYVFPDHEQNTATHPHDTLSLELSSLASVREAAATINKRVAAGEIPPIRALILNAAYHEMDAQRFLDNGFATIFVATYLGNWLLVLLLLQSMDRDMGRIVVLGSNSHNPYFSGNAHLFKEEKHKTILQESTTDPIAKGTWSSYEEDPSFAGGMRRYGASKLCMIMMIGELQRRLSTDPALSNISILGVDPGPVPTNIARRSSFLIRVVMFKILIPFIVFVQESLHIALGKNEIRSPQKAAEYVLAGAMDSNPVLGERPQGMYLEGPARAEISDEAKDEKKRLMVWKDSVRYAELKGEETMLVDWE